MDASGVIASLSRGGGNDAASAQPVSTLNPSAREIDSFGTLELAAGTGLTDAEMKGMFLGDVPNQSIPPKYQGSEPTKRLTILGERLKNGERRPLQGPFPDNRHHVPADAAKSKSRTTLIPNTDPFFSNLYTHPPDAEITSLSQSRHRYEASSSQGIIHVATERELDTFSSVTEPQPFTTHACTAGFLPAQVPAALRILQYIKAHPTTAEAVNPPIPYELITSELAEIRDGWGWCLIGACRATREDEGRASAEKASNKILSSISTDHKRGDVGSRRRADALYDHIRREHLRYRPYWCEICLRRFSDKTELARHGNGHGPSLRDDTNGSEM